MSNTLPSELDSIQPSFGLPAFPKKEQPVFTDSAVPFQSDFLAASQRYGVPVNVIMGMAEQESSFNPKALGVPTAYGRAKGIMQYIDSTASRMGINPYDPVQSIDAAAKQLRERLDKGYTMEEAVKAHFAGDDRKQWGPKTAAYGQEVLARAEKFISGNFAAPAQTVADASAPAQAPAFDPQTVFAELNKDEPDRYRPLTEEEMKRVSQHFTPELQQDALSKSVPGVPIEINIPDLDLTAPPPMSDDGEDWDNIQPEGNKDGNLLTDAGVLLLSGLNYTAQNVQELVSKIPYIGKPIVEAANRFDKWANGKDSNELFKSWEKGVKENLTPEMLAARKKAFVIEPGDKLADGKEANGYNFGPAWSDPRTYMSGILESLPEMAVTMGASGRLAQMSYKAAIKKGATKEVAAKAAAKTATIAGGILEGSLAGASTSRTVRDQILALDEKQMKDSEALKALMADGKMSFEQAKAVVADDAASQAFWLAGVSTGIFGGLGDRTLAKIITGDGGIVKSTVKGAIGEGLIEEMPQSIGQKMSENKAMQKADPNISLGKGVPNAAASGLAIGGVMGAGLGAMAPRAGKPEVKNKKPAERIDPTIPQDPVPEDAAQADEFAGPKGGKVFLPHSSNTEFGSTYEIQGYTKDGIVLKDRNGKAYEMKKDVFSAAVSAADKIHFDKVSKLQAEAAALQQAKGTNANAKQDRLARIEAEIQKLNENRPNKEISSIIAASKAQPKVSEPEIEEQADPGEFMGPVGSDTVVVPSEDPNEKFTGKVVGYRNGMARIMDANGEIYDIEPKDVVIQERPSDTGQAATYATEEEDIKASLFDEMGRVKAPKAQSRRDFKEKHNLNNDAVLALISAQADGKPLSIADARDLGIARAKDRAASVAASQTPEAIASSDERERLKEAEKQKEKDDYIADYEKSNAKIKPGVYESETGLIYQVSESGTIFDVTDGYENRSPYGTIVAGKADENGVAFVSYLKDGYVKKSAHDFMPGDSAIWKNADSDTPVVFEGVEAEAGSDGRTYAKVTQDGKTSFVPLDELAPAQKAAEPLKAADKPLDQMNEQELRDRLKYVNSMGKQNGWDKRLTTERKIIESAIDSLATKQPQQEQPAEEQPVKWFGSADKANGFIQKKNLGDTHEVVPVGNSRFEIREKQQADKTKSPHFQRSTKLVGPEGAVLSPSMDIGQAKAGGKYVVEKIDKDGTVHLGDQVTNALIKLTRQEIEKIRPSGIKWDSVASTVVETPKAQPEQQQDEWQQFPSDSGSLGIPRSDMPQVKAEHRGAMVNYLNARGVAHTEQSVPADSLKPTQGEYSTVKVQKAKDFEGGSRSILVSADGYVLDGHHQWMAAKEQGQEVKVIRLDAPITDLIDMVKEFPSSTVDTASAAANQPADDNSKEIQTEKSAAPQKKEFSRKKWIAASLGNPSKGDKVSFSIQVGSYTDANQDYEVISIDNEGAYLKSDNGSTQVSRFELGLAKNKGLVVTVKKPSSEPTPAAANEVTSGVYPSVVYRGQPAGKQLRLSESGLLWLTPEKSYAEDPHYGGKDGAEVVELTVKSGLRIFDHQRADHQELLRSVKKPVFRAAANGGFRALSDPDVIAHIKGLGFDGFKAIEPEGQQSLALFDVANVASQSSSVPAAPEKPAVSENKIFTEDAAERARQLLRSKLSQLNSGIDPEIMQAGITLAGYHIEKGARTFSAFAQAMIADLGDMVRPYLKSWYMGVKYDPRATGFEGMSSAADVEAADINSIKAESNEPDTAGSVEQDSAIPDNAMGEGLSAADRSDKLRNDERSTTERLEKGRAGRGNSSSVSAAGTADAGTQADQPMAEQDGQSGDAPGVTGGSDSRGNSKSSNRGIRAERQSDKRIREKAESRERQLNERGTLQAAADAVPVVTANDQNIRETLPLLSAPQQDDVIKAEKRLFTQGKKGMMFTNGTGTGKTYTALGVIKRTLRRGGSVLVVSPAGVTPAWAKGAKDILIDEVHTLSSKTDSGKPGLNLTSFQNFRDNQELLKRNFDLVVYDESHHLMASMGGDETTANAAHKALTGHPDYVNVRGHMAMKSEFDAYTADADAAVQKLVAKGMEFTAANRQVYGSPAFKNRYDKLNAAADKLSKQLAKEKVDTKVLFLSASPFSGHKSVFYADGYLFDSKVGAKTSQAYNTGSAEAQFLVNNFGYRMRYNRVTQPGAEVDVALLERDWADRMFAEGSMSGRTLELESDYSREFAVVAPGIGKAIDDAFKIIDWKNYPKLNAQIVSWRKGGADRQLTEALRARAALQRIQQHLDMGRKVVVFHERQTINLTNPFDFKADDAETVAEINRLKAANPEIFRIDLSGLQPAPAVIGNQFGDLVGYFSGQNKSTRDKDLSDFNNDDGTKRILVIQKDAGKEGLSAHDITGKYQRALMILNTPVSPADAIQMEGRVYRHGLKSDAVIEYPTIQTSFEKTQYRDTVSSRTSTAENLAMGSQARSLREAFREGYLDPATDAPNAKQGKGGRNSDRAGNGMTMFDRAKTYYFRRAKKTSKTKAQEGTDYFATPEPLGFKMVEWAGLLPGEKVLEPSAGHGAIARWFPESVDGMAIEQSSNLSGELGISTGAEVRTMDFEDFNTINKFNAVVMNPPFGVGGSTAIKHIEKAVKHLRDGGRIIAIYPNGPAADKKFNEWYEGAAGVYVTATINLPTATFERAGTSVSTRILIIDKNTKGTMSRAPVNIDLSNLENINELFDRIKSIEVPERPNIFATAREAGLNESDITKLDRTIYRAALSEFTSGGKAKQVGKKELKKLAEKFGAEVSKSDASYWDETFYDFETKADRDRFYTAVVDKADELKNPQQDNTRYSASAQTETEAFKRWFGDSKVVDENGKPLVVYHGTGENFTEFSLEKSGTKTDTGMLGKGFYFSTDPDYAGQYAARGENPNVISAYLSLQNPFTTKNLRELPSVPEPETIEEMEVADILYSQQLRQSLISSGYDGVVYETPDGKKEIVAFYPEQIKSATGNTGTFDPANPDIRYGMSAEQIRSTPSEGMQLDQVQAIADKIVSEFTGDMPLSMIITQTQDELYGPSPRANGVYIKGAYHPERNAFTLIAENLDNPRDVRKTIIHEFIAHYGLDTFDAQSRQELLQKVIDSRGTKEKKGTLYDMWEKISTDPFYGQKSEIIQAEEVFAHTAESMGGKFQQFFDSIRSLIIKGLRKLGLIKSPLTNTEIRLVIRSIAQGIRNGSRYKQSQFDGEKPGKTPQISTEAFKRWFGDSKIVNESGKPLRMYHGTKSDFSKFGSAKQAGGLIFFTDNPAVASEYSDGARSGYSEMARYEDMAGYKGVAKYNPDSFDGIYLKPSDDADLISDLLYDLDTSVTLDLHDKLQSGEITPSEAVRAFNNHVDEMQSGGNVMPVYIKAENPAGSKENPIPWKIAERNGAEYYKQQGYDAVYVTEADGYALAVFDPRQIKSATGNTGSFDSDNPDIMLSQAPQIGTAAFKRWFGDSKVVDESGKPLVVYHGSPDIRGVINGGFKPLSNRGGVYFFSDDYAVSNTYADPKRAWDYQNSEPATIPLYLSLQNPMVIDAQGRKWRETEKHIEEARAKGHDGIIIKNSRDEYNNIGNGGRLSTVYAVFQPEQIKSAATGRLKSRVDGIDLGDISNTGTFEPTNPDIRFSQRPSSKEVDSWIAQKWEATKELTDDALTSVMPALLHLTPGRTLLTRVGKDIPALAHYADTKLKMDTFRDDWHAITDKLAQRWQKYRVLNSKENSELMDIMHESTLRQVDPSEEFKSILTPMDRKVLKEHKQGTEAWDAANERANTDATRQHSYNTLQQRFDKLSPEAKAIYQQVRNTYQKLADTQEQIILDNIEKAMGYKVREAQRKHEEELQRIKDEGLKGKERNDAIEKADKALANASRLDAWNKRAKLNQLRSEFESNRLAGPYFPLSRFGDFFVTARDKKTGEVEFFSRQESARDQTRVAKELKAQGFDVETGFISKSADLRKQIPAEFVATIEDLLKGIPGTEETQDQVWQLFLERMPDISIRKNRIHRKGRAGFEEDALRAFASHMFHGAHQTAKLKYSMALEDLLDEAKRQVKNTRNPTRSGMVLEQANKSHQYVMNPTSNAISQIATQGAFIWYLASSPAAALLNMAQTVIVGPPKLAAFYDKGTAQGIAMAVGQINRALFDLANGKTFAENSPRVTPEEKAAVAQAYRVGLITRTQSHDVAGIADSGIKYSPIRAKIMAGISWMFHHTERVNREATFLAAYRVAKKKGLHGDNAIHKAMGLTWDIHYDYQNTSRPPIMHSNTGKALLVFRNYSLNMISDLAYTAYEIINPRNAQERREARTQMVGLLGTLAFNAGIRGLPLYGIMMVIAGMFSDDDEDPEVELKKSLLEYLPPSMVGMMMDGVPGYTLGVEISSRIGFGDLWFRSDNMDKEGDSEYLSWLQQVLGAASSIPYNIYKGVNQINDGYAWRGMENILPKMIKDPMKSWRYVQEGVTTKHGDPIVDEVGGWDIFKQAIGVTPARIAEQHKMNSYNMNKQKSILDQRSKLLTDFYKAWKAGEDAQQQKILDKMQAYSQEYPEMAIDSDAIRQSLKRREKYRGQNVGGMNYNPNLLPRLQGEQPGTVYR